MLSLPTTPIRVENYGVVQAPVQQVQQTAVQPAQDHLAVEEPLEIRLVYARDGRPVAQSISITMRTPGHDAELALGFLWGEGILRHPDDVAGVQHNGPPGCRAQKQNTVTVHLRDGVSFDAARLERHFYTTSSCGVCGKASLEALQTNGCPALPPDRPVLHAADIHVLPHTLRRAQAVFDQTGGLHAAALFDAEGMLLDLREDVGRHNAVDKLVGACLLTGRLPLHDGVLLVSGRASFELVQKAVMAGCPFMAAVSAPSSLAVELARAHGMTLLGFVRDGRFNVYAGAERVRGLAHLASQQDPSADDAL